VTAERVGFLAEDLNIYWIEYEMQKELKRDFKCGGGVWLYVAPEISRVVMAVDYNGEERSAVADPPEFIEV
jgi:hypothetical protein